MSKVVRLKLADKRAYTANERLIDDVREKIFLSGKTFKQIAISADVAKSTVGKLANGGTQWPRPKTLFGVLHAIGYTIEIVKEHR